MNKNTSPIGKPEFGKYLHLASAYKQACGEYRQFMTANWCGYCHHYEHEHERAEK